MSIVLPFVPPPPTPQRQRPDALACLRLSDIIDNLQVIAIECPLMLVALAALVRRLSIRVRRKHAQ